MTDATQKYDSLHKRVNLALIQRIMGNIDDDYRAIVRGDGYGGKLFHEVHKECLEQAADCKWVSTETIYKIMQMPSECTCLLCHMVGTSLIIPMCVIVTMFMRAPCADARHASLFANIMDGSTIRIAHDHGIVTQLGDTLLLSSGNYTIANLIAIIAGARI